MADSTRKPGDSLPNVKQSRVAQATAGEAAAKLTAGSTYNATVKARQADGTYSLSIDDPKVPLEGALLALPIMGGHLGLQVRCNLPPNTKVKIAYGNPSFIFAVLPDNNADWLNARNRSLVWGDAMDPKQGVTANQFNSQAEDILEGEVEFSNLFGVSMEFLTTIMRMRAGDRALVECHLINDMIRLVSGQFRHISGLGQDLVFDHGRPTMERTWSSYRHEVLGKLKEKENYAPLNGDEVDRDALEERRVTGMGRYRFLEFLGFAGDFIHSFVSDPPETMSVMAKGQAMAGAGKSMFHRNSDGSIVMQSVADIRIERVTRIPVPVRCEPHEDPEVTKAREYDNLAAEFLKLPDAAISPVNPLDIYQAAYHIRQYARWLGRYHSFARMLQLEDEYEIESESESPAPEWTNREEDREDANPRIEYYDAYACMSIMRDGSIINHDGYGSTVAQSNGNVQVSASRHIDIEAAGDIRMVAGDSIYIKARRNIEISATIGGLIMHGYAWLKGLCERGTAWWRSNAQTGPEASEPQPKEADGPTPEIAGGHEEGHAVLIEASEGGAAYRSEKGAQLVVDGSPADEDDDSANLVVSTGGDLDLHGQRKADLHSQTVVRISSARDLVLATNTLMSSATRVFIGPNVEEPLLIMKGGQFFVAQIETFYLKSNLISGPKVGPIVPPEAISLSGESVKEHYNHIVSHDPDENVERPEAGDEDDKALMQEAIELSGKTPQLPWNGSSDGPKWKFPSRSEYVWGNREESVGGVPETLTQQHLRVDSTTNTGGGDRWEGPGYEEWRLRTDIQGKRTDPRSGFGNYETQYRASDEGEDLHEPSPTAPADMPEVQIAWTASPDYTIRRLKRPE